MTCEVVFNIFFVLIIKSVSHYGNGIAWA